MTDPYRVLGVSHEVDDAAVRAAYLAAVRECPPERDAERFAALRQAYDALATQRARLAHELFDSTPPTPQELFHALAEGCAPRRPDAAALLRLLGGKADGR